MNVYKMCDSTVMKFVNIYRENECLWNTNSKNYKNKGARLAAYKKISEEMNINGFGLTEVAQKIKNLRSAYYQEVKRIENSKKTSVSTDCDIYRPKVVWFSTLNDFLKQHIYKNSKRTQRGTSVVSLVECHSSEESSQLSHATDIPDAEIKFEVGETEITENNGSKSTENQNFPGCILKKLDEISGKVLATLKYDHFDIFGRYVSACLRNLPTENAIIVESEIHKILTQEKLKVFRKNATNDLLLSSKSVNLNN